MQIGFIGLGNMGRSLVLNLMDDEHNVVGWNRSEGKRELARTEGISVVDSLSDLADSTDQDRRVVWLMVSAGSAIDQILFDEGNLSDLLSEGDIIIDGANSHYTDTKRRAEQLDSKGIIFLDCGVSGGIEAARTGASLMIGGNKFAFEYAEEIFKSIATEGGYGYFGNTGSGHYVKMVHNGIEYGMMQAIAEGLNLINGSNIVEGIDIPKLIEVWNNGSVIESNLINFASKAFANDPDLSKTDPEIGSLGTGKWTVAEALRIGVPMSSISHAVFSRYSSRGNDDYLFRVVQAMRSEFGGHSSEERPS